jgi:hypothetical protein
MAEFVAGANLPWLDYGGDFGANAWQPHGGLARPERRARARDALAELAERGARLVRWWVLGDGRCGLGPQDAPPRLDDRVLGDLDVAMQLVADARLRALLVLIDHLWFARPRRVDGVVLGGRAGSVSDAGRRLELVERVFLPLAERYGREPVVFGWDLVNEPEWATLGVGTLDPRRAVPRHATRALVADLKAVFHAHATQPVTVGLASARWLPLLDGLDLDFHQVHWYESLDPLEELTRPVTTRGLSGPLLLGEFPTRGASLPPARLLRLAELAGYSGALAWSALAEDRATDGPACRAALAAWSTRAAEARRA